MDSAEILSLLITIIVALMTLVVALKLRKQDFVALRDHPKAALVGVTGQLLVMPGVAFGIAWLFALSPVYAIGLVLLAACPGGSTSNILTDLAGGDRALSVSLTAISGVATIVSIPLWVSLAGATFSGAALNLSFPVLATLRDLVLMIGLPLAVGMFYQSRHPERALRVSNILRPAVYVLLLLLVIGGLTKFSSILFDANWATVAATAMLLLLAMSIAIAAAYTLDIPRAQRIALPLELGMQSAALAIALALSSLKTPELATPAAIYSCLMYWPTLAYALWMRKPVSVVSAP